MTSKKITLNAYHLLLTVAVSEDFWPIQGRKETPLDTSQYIIKSKAFSNILISADDSVLFDWFINFSKHPLQRPAVAPLERQEAQNILDPFCHVWDDTVCITDYLKECIM